MLKTFVLSMCLAISAVSHTARAQDVNAGAKDAGAKDTGAKDAGAKDAGAKDAGAKDAGANRAKDKREFTYGPVTLVQYIHVYYGRFDEYMAWVTSTWLPTMEAEKKAGLIIDYKVFQSDPKSPDDANVYLEITFKNFAAYGGDIGDKVYEFEAVTEKVICNSACQNQARVHRNELRRILGNEVVREIVFK